jgi:16S rRNA (guanine1207-N2)-methyltransferase
MKTKKDVRKVTYAEALLLDAVETASGTPRRVLTAGNRSGGVPVALMRRWPEAEVVAHAFDAHHARAIRKRLLDESLPPRQARCTAGVASDGTDALGPAEGVAPYDVAFFMTTPRSMPAELVLDQLQDIHENLAEGGAFYAAFEGDPDDALNVMRLVWRTVNVVKRAKHAVLFRAVRRGEPVKQRVFAADWQASVPGGQPLTLTTYPGCFCHRRADTGGLALAEVAAREVASWGGGRILDVGCGCGLVGLLVADAARRLNPEARWDLTLVDSHARAIAAAKVNAARAGIEAEFILSDDGLPRGRVGEFDLFVGNPPYYSDYRIADVFLETAYCALKPGGLCLSVVKTASGLVPVQEKYFSAVEVIKRRGYCILKSIR